MKKKQAPAASALAKQKNKIVFFLFTPTKSFYEEKKAPAAHALTPTKKIIKK